MKTIFIYKTNSRVRPFDMLIKSRNTEKHVRWQKPHGTGTKIWNALTKNITKETPF